MNRIASKCVLLSSLHRSGPDPRQHVPDCCDQPGSGQPAGPGGHGTCRHTHRKHGHAGRPGGGGRDPGAVTSATPGSSRAALIGPPRRLWCRRAVSRDVTPCKKNVEYIFKCTSAGEVKVSYYRWIVYYVKILLFFCCWCIFFSLPFSFMLSLFLFFFFLFFWLCDVLYVVFISRQIILDLNQKENQKAREERHRRFNHNLSRSPIFIVTHVLTVLGFFFSKLYIQSCAIVRNLCWPLAQIHKTHT